MRNRVDQFERILRSLLLVTCMFSLFVSMESVLGLPRSFLYLEPDTTVTSPPVFLQTGTAGSSTIYANNTSAKVSAAAPFTPTYYPSSYNILSGNWWNSNYAYRKIIAINNNIASVLSTGYSVFLTVDTASMVSGGKMLSNGNDLRIVWWNTSSSSWLELDRDVQNMNTTSTKIWFRTRANIVASAADTNYYMYYGYSSAGSPPANRDNVYVFWDDFESGNLNKWSIQSGSWTAATDQKVSGTYSLKTTSGGSTWIKPSGSISEKDALLESYWRSSDSGFDFAGALRVQSGASMNWFETNVEGAPGWDIAKMVNDGWTEIISNGGSYSANTWYKVTFIVIGETQGKVLVNDIQVTPSSGWANIGTDFVTPGTIAFRAGIVTTAGWVDNVKVRKYVDPEPFVSPGSEEPRYQVSGTVPASVQSVDSSYLITRSAASATSTSSYNPSGYNLVGSTSFVSGATSDLASNNGAYMTFRSYASATSGQALYAHQETMTIGGSSYYFQRLTSADTAGTTLSASAATTGRKLMGRFVHQLTGVPSIPASTWTIYYRASRDSGSAAGHGDVDILIRMSNGTVRTTVATNVANTGFITTSWSTLTATYSWTAYTVVSQTDYLEIDYYIEVTGAQSGRSMYLRIDDNTLATVDQTRTANIILPSEFTSEVELTGSSNTQAWYQLVWTADSAWTTSSVSVTIQIFNYTLNGYPTSGNGYYIYTSSSTADTDETRTQTIITNPTQFRDGSGNWKIKVKGVKTTTSQFDFKADWIEFKPTYNSEYTVSTEFLFSSMTTNTPTQLNFTVVSEYDIASVSVTIQVWNYSSSAYVTSGEGYLTYSSSGSNETKVLSINTKPQNYTSSGNARIRVRGVLAMTTQYQQKANQVKLAYKYSSSSNYNYVLKIMNQVSDTWKIRLRAYSDSNKGRLNNCTIYFRNASDGTSRQIYIQNGAYMNQTGSWYDIPASPAERYIVIVLSASGSQVSYVYSYLEILVPNKTTYAQYVITFEIT